MRTRQRMKGLQSWVNKNLCDGRMMKAPGAKMNIKDIERKQPVCYVGWAPGRLDQMTGMFKDEPQNVVPGIIIMPSQSLGKHMEEQRFDRYNNIHRPPMLGQTLSVSILFIVYEPGTRLPGFIDSIGEKGKGLDTTLILEGTEDGLFTLTDWMDDCLECLLRDKSIPGTDLFVREETISYSLYTDQEYVVDKRPLFYGFVNVTFGAYAEEGNNENNLKLLL